MDDITNLLHMTFRKNMQFLKENHLDIYYEIEKLSQTLENNNTEQYSIQIKNDYFDILNHNDNSYFYATNSFEQANLISKYINFSKDGSLDLLRKIPQTNKLVFNDYYYEMKPIINFINNNVDFQNIEFKKIYKFVYIGTGLGFHIQEINKKINSYVTLIIEPDIEIFRLSLFTTDYTIFEEGNRKLFFSIGDDKLKRLNNLGNFSAYHDYMNYSIKYYNFLESTSYLRKELIDFFGNNSVVDFPYKAIIQVFGRTLHYMKERNKFISLPKSLDKNILNNKKLLIVSAGPSLDNYIEWIKKYQDKFTIVCVDVITRKLEKNGIRPDIVFSIDPSERCADFLNTENPDFLANSVIILLSQQNLETYELLKNKNIFFTQGLLLQNKLGYFGSSPNVGTFSFLASVLLQAKELYLIGCDAAFNQETGERYAKDSSHFIKDKQKNNDDKIYDQDDLVIVKGNLRDSIKTNNGLLGFRSDYERTIFALKESFDFKCYNLSDGVHIEGIIPITKDEITQLAESFHKKSFDLIEKFNSISEIIHKEEMNYISLIKNIKLIIKKVDKFKKIDFISSDNFLDKKLEITSFILESLRDEKDYVVANIFLKFIALSDIYINFILNLRQKELNEKKTLNKLGKYWAEAVIDVFNHILAIIKVD
jgi:hypothetical protein